MANDEIRRIVAQPRLEPALVRRAALSSFVSSVPSASSVRSAAAQEPSAPQAVSPAAAAGRDRQAGRSRLRDPDQRVAHGAAHRRRAGRAGAAAGGRRARRRLRPLSRARAAHRLQRSADEGRDARVADRARTIACARSAYSFFEHNPDPAMVAAVAGRARQGAGASSSGRRWSARSRRSAPTIRACSRRCCARSGAARTSSAAP